MRGYSFFLFSAISWRRSAVSGAEAPRRPFTAIKKANLTEDGPGFKYIKCNLMYR